MATFTNAAFAVQKKEAVKTADKLGHNFKIQQRNDTQHWNKCSRCDKCDAKKNHIGGAAACITKAECVVCYAKYGEIGTNNHSRLKKGGRDFFNGSKHGYQGALVLQRLRKE